MLIPGRDEVSDETSDAPKPETLPIVVHSERHRDTSTRRHQSLPALASQIIPSISDTFHSRGDSSYAASEVKDKRRRPRSDVSHPRHEFSHRALRSLESRSSSPRSASSKSLVPSVVVSPSSTSSSAAERAIAYPARAEAHVDTLLNGSYESSTMSLPEYRLVQPRFIYPVPDQEIRVCVEDKPAVPLEDLGITLDSHRLRGREVAGGTPKNRVYCHQFWSVDKRTPELLAIKYTTRSKPEALEQARAEARILKEIRHNHIIALAGSFAATIKGNEGFGVILFPIATMDLGDYMEKVYAGIEKDVSKQAMDLFCKGTTTLLSFFPCLCNAVMYLHTLPKPIKHRDIKPSNVLIDRTGAVILADFDIAKIYDSRDDRTKGRTDHTELFAPGSVQEEAERGFEWDVISLGFLFLEVTAVIFGAKPFELRSRLQLEPGSIKGYAAAVQTNLATEWIKELREQSRRDPNYLPESLRRSETEPEGLKYVMVDDFLRVLSDMMHASLTNNGAILENSWQFYANLSKPCANCLQGLKMLPSSGLSFDRHHQLNGTPNRPPSASGSRGLSSVREGILNSVHSTDITTNEHASHKTHPDTLEAASLRPVVSETTTLRGYDELLEESRDLLVDCERPNNDTGISHPDPGTGTMNDGLPEPLPPPEMANEQKVQDLPPYPVVPSIQSGEGQSSRTYPRFVGIEGRHVLFYRRMEGLCTVHSEDHDRLMEQGACVLLPRVRRTLVETPAGKLDLWKILGWKLHIKRASGKVKAICFIGYG